MQILTIREDQAGTAAIQNAWRGSETFIVLPSKCAVDRGWLDSSLSELPKCYATDHFCLLSSGSTGAPKLFLASKARAERLARTLHEVQDSACVRQTILALPLSYSYAFVNQFVWAEVFGRRLTESGGLARPESLAAALGGAEDAMLCLVGTQAKVLLDTLPRKQFPGIVRLHFAGGAFPRERLIALRQMFQNAAIFNNYGCIEAMPRLTVHRVGEELEEGQIGTPIPGVELACGPSGQLLFRSDYRAVGQLDPSGLIEASSSDFQNTGDVAEQSADGRWRLLGRSAEVFKRHGEKVAVQQIVTNLMSAWKGQAAAYRENDVAGEVGYVLAVAPSPTSIELAGLLQSLREKYPRSHWPLRIESRCSLPSSPNGKLDYLALSSLPGATLHWRQRI
jgi:acyl-CoA synthetase (AMP-forming)/AMP-acid ligase II